MYDLIWLNGTVKTLHEGRVSPASAGVLYGWGVFTTLGVAAGRALAFERHWERLTAHAERAGVPLDRGREVIEQGLGELIERTGVAEGRARITLLRSGAGPWQAKSAAGNDALIFVAPRASREQRPLAVTLSPHRINTSSPLVGIKSTAYFDHLLALEEARGRGFNEAIILNERGEVAEATAANVFWVRGGELYTPSLATGCLAGITRRLVLEAAEKRRMRVTEGSFALAMLGEADELFLTNSSWGVSPVGELDIHRYGPAPIAARLAADVEGLLGK